MGPLKTLRVGATGKKKNADCLIYLDKQIGLKRFNGELRAADVAHILSLDVKPSVEHI